MVYYLIVNCKSNAGGENGRFYSSSSLLYSDHESAMADPEPESSVKLTSDLLLSFFMLYS